MRTRILLGWVLIAAFFPAPQVGAQKFLDPSEGTAGEVDMVPPSPAAQKEIVDRIIAREKATLEAIGDYSPIVETYTQQIRPDKQLGTVPKSDFYFLGQADFRGPVKVHSLLANEKKSTWMWSYNPAGFLQMVFLERDNFDAAHYRFDYRRREFLGEVRCLVFDVEQLPKTRGARFRGAIWVEDQDMNIVRFNGRYEPAIHFSLKSFEDEYYLHFDSWRTNVQPGLWLPSQIFIQENDRPDQPLRFSGPSFKAQTYLWGYRLAATGREAELSRVLVEAPTAVKEEAQQHDRSPLEAQREWRHEAENNVIDLLERNGLIAPPGDLDKVLNTIIKNIAITNNIDDQVDLHCRVLLTGNLEQFSVGNTVVLSRGLIDVVPDEAAMAAMLAYSMADAMLPKPYQDRYAFSDIMRLTATEVLRHMSFEEQKNESVENSAKAIELLRKSPYAPKLASAGLFLSQLRAQSKALRRLIDPQLGNAVYFETLLMQSAPALNPSNMGQVAALPLGSRVKIDPWTNNISLRKSKPVSLLSPRDKMPFEVTPLRPYLTRYAETPAPQPASSPSGLD